MARMLRGVFSLGEHRTALQAAGFYVVHLLLLSAAEVFVFFAIPAVEQYWIHAIGAVPVLVLYMLVAGFFQGSSEDNGQERQREYAQMKERAEARTQWILGTLESEQEQQGEEVGAEVQRESQLVGILMLLFACSAASLAVGSVSGGWWLTSSYCLLLSLWLLLAKGHLRKPWPLLVALLSGVGGHYLGGFLGLALTAYLTTLSSTAKAK